MISADITHNTFEVVHRYDHLYNVWKYDARQDEPWEGCWVLVAVLEDRDEAIGFVRSSIDAITLANKRRRNARRKRKAANS